MAPASVQTPLLAADSPLDRNGRELVVALFEKERQAAFELPTDDPLDPKRRRRVALTLPEIEEQPAAISRTLAAERNAIADAARDIAAGRIDRVYLTGCGDSLAVMVAIRCLMEEMLGVPCEPVQALDLAYYGQRTIGPRSLVVTLSSSGTTTRTVEAMLIAKARGARSLSLTNTPGSALMLNADHALLIHATRKGWPTQASTAAMALLAQLAIEIGKARGVAGTGALQAGLDAVPGQIGAVIEAHSQRLASLAEREADRSMFLFAAAGPAYASALFGAAKIKECTPDHALAIPLEEFHHYNSQKRGDPLFLIAPAGHSLPRARDTAAEGKRWGGTVYALVTGDEAGLDELADAVFRLPAVAETLAPLVYTVPVQLFAYHVAMAQFAAAELAGG